MEARQGMDESCARARRLAEPGGGVSASDRYPAMRGAGPRRGARQGRPGAVPAGLAFGLPLSLVASLAWVSDATSAAATAPERVVVRAEYDRAEQLQSLAAAYGHLVVDPEARVLMVETDAFGRRRLERLGFRVSVADEATVAVNRPQPIGELAKAIGGLTCYRTVEETYAAMDALASARPDLVEVIDIGPSWRLSQGLSGYPLRVIRATNEAIPGPKPKLFVMSSVHAREYTPAETMTRFVEGLVNGHGRDPDATWMLDHHEVHALLQANPDGRKLAEAQWNSTASGQRKNANAGFCAATRIGVDLNRNFPFAWNSTGGSGSSGEPCSDSFRGPSAASEPETGAVTQYVRSIFPDARGGNPLDAAPDDTPGVFIDMHSFSRLVLWPWGATSTVAPNGAPLQTLGRRLAWFNGYTPQQSTGLYLTDGTTIDFAYGELGVAALTFELGVAFFESCGTFQSTVLPDNLRSLAYALRIAREPYRLPAGPETREVAITPDLVVRGEPATLSARVDDTRFSTVSAPPNPVIQPQHAIVAAQALIGTPPWQQGAVALPLAASDGAFDSTSEQVGASLATTALPAGRHLVYVRGRDANPDVPRATGPVAAGFLRIVEQADLALLSGRVTAAATGEAVAATLRIDDLVATSDPATGDYTRRLVPGSFTLEVEAPGFEPARVAPITVAPGAVLTRNVALFRWCPRLADDGEPASPTTFSATSPWQRRAGSGIGGGGGWIAGTGTSYPANANASLTSAALDLSADATVILRFEQRCATQARFDFGIVEVRSEPTAPWTEVHRCEGDPTWRRIELPLPQLAGAAAAQLRFRFTSDASTSGQGFAIDDIILDTSGTACRAAQDPARDFADGFEP